MMSTDIVVTGENLSAAWARTVVQVAGAEGHRACHVVTRIQDASLEAEDPKVRELADGWLTALGYPPVRTVANTLFPQQMATLTPDPDELAERYLALLPTVRQLDPDHNGKGTYFQRIVDYQTPDGPVNQLSELIRRLQAELRAAEKPRGSAKTARYEVGVDGTGLVEPLTGAAPIHAAGVDTSSIGFPCLSLLSFQLDRGHLHVAAHYRSHYLIRRAYGNYLGIAQLLQYVAERSALLPGRMTIVAGYAQVDMYNASKVDLLRSHVEDGSLLDLLQ